VLVCVFCVLCDCRRSCCTAEPPPFFDKHILLRFSLFFAAECVCVTARRYGGGGRPSPLSEVYGITMVSSEGGYERSHSQKNKLAPTHRLATPPHPFNPHADQQHHPRTDDLQKFSREPNATVFLNDILLQAGIVQPAERVKCIMAIKSSSTWAREMPEYAISGLPTW
jgi:hypothetical protein